MKIAIVGGGKVGKVLCQEFSADPNNEVVLIENNDHVLEKIMNRYDIQGILGNGASYEILREAQVETVDMFIAVSQTDEINIIASVIAKQMGAAFTIARVRSPEYSFQLNAIRKRLGIDLLINPDYTAAATIARMLRYPKALSVESFASDRVNLVEIEIDAGSSLVGLHLRDFRKRYGDILLCIIHRGDEVIIPKGDAVLQAGDLVHMTGQPADLRRFFHKIYGRRHKHRALMIVGGGRLTYYLLDLLRHDDIKKKIIEINPAKCLELSQSFPRDIIIHGDGVDQELLLEEGLPAYDTFLSLTGSDEENLILSLFAYQSGLEKTITKVNRVNMLKLLNRKEIRSVITPKHLVANEIIQFIRAIENAEGSNIQSLYRLVDQKVEALQFIVKSGSQICRDKLAHLDMLPNALIAYIIRQDQLIFPSGNDIIQANDQVIVVTTATDLDDLDDLLIETSAQIRK